MQCLIEIGSQKGSKSRRPAWLDLLCSLPLHYEWCIISRLVNRDTWREGFRLEQSHHARHEGNKDTAMTVVFSSPSQKTSPALGRHRLESAAARRCKEPPCAPLPRSLECQEKTRDGFIGCCARRNSAWAERREKRAFPASRGFVRRVDEVVSCLTSDPGLADTIPTLGDLVPSMSVVRWRASVG
ncbi:hypothetical protein LZ30DRAFT_16122 [Colletotrichum cereale]|nr:hypothetical protein LZ30DRAFT_16122 [Colletotrichum cereale]